MPFISADELRIRLPRDGEGISDAEIQEAIDAAVAYVVVLTDDPAGSDGVAREAVADMAFGKIMDLVFPRDAREPVSVGTRMRQDAIKNLNAYLKAKAESDSDPSTPNVPVIYVEEEPRKERRWHCA